MGDLVHILGLFPWSLVLRVLAVVMPSVAAALSLERAKNLKVTSEEETPDTSVVFGSVARPWLVVTGTETNVLNSDSAASQMKVVVNTEDHGEVP